MSPFQYADYYVGAVSLGSGLNLLSNIYGTSVAYAIDAGIIRTLPAAFIRFAGKNTPLAQSALGQLLLRRTGIPGTGIVSKIPGLGGLAGLCTGGFTGCEYERLPSLDFATLYTSFAQLYIAVYSPIIIIAIGMLFIQFLGLPIMQYTAFTIILPVAIAMRSLSFFGAHIGDASNALIAIAIAFYIIYPLRVAFDSYAIAYVFSANNPAANYTGGAFVVNTISPFSYLQSQPPTLNNATSGLSLVKNQIQTYLCATPGSSYCLPSFTMMSTVHTYTDEMAQFVYQAVLLFALNITITAGLAMSIYKALKSGLGEAGRFW